MKIRGRLESDIFPYNFLVTYTKWGEWEKYWETKLFRDLPEAVRFAQKKNGLIFGLNPEYQFEYTVKEVTRELER